MADKLAGAVTGVVMGSQAAHLGVHAAAALAAKAAFATTAATAATTGTAAGVAVVCTAACAPIAIGAGLLYGVYCLFKN